VFKDARGRNINDAFPSISEGQINISYSYPGTIRAFHRHKNQWDNWRVIKGNLEIATYTEEDGLQLFYMGEGDGYLSIDPGRWHGFRVLDNKEAILLYYVTNKYDPDNPDEERAEWNAFYNWETPRK
jgi:dTDP-4-dehydrorhamnose 3,5-epimerase